ncbi:hypothetical protein D3C87_2183590 [compost metagenome]
MLVAVALPPVLKMCEVDHEFDYPLIPSPLTKVIGNRRQRIWCFFNDARQSGMPYRA